ncbi:hypothetical protein E2562_012087 [Oryza meyeriana var. granulata]|uniref:Ribulose bisphosphate carboxylase/oxygenase activase AAA helical domain-containing protein n=1 Tax=Oryza meyeriana var. granulata TaxID=110450 RepID=A0A6G1F747_9ORYZ|nr:hypothetical protein E2562_012087 [Oryza meyeriana var. granulata]
MSAGELESSSAGEQAKLIRQRYREAAETVRKGKMCALFINDLDAGATQYTVNNQMVNATLMNIADSPTNVKLPGQYSRQDNPRVPVVVTGNDFSTLYAPLIRDGRMDNALRARVYDDEVRRWVAEVGVENVGRKLVNSADAPPAFEPPKVTLSKLEYGVTLVEEQENVKRVQLADKYLRDAALGDANEER